MLLHYPSTVILHCSSNHKYSVATASAPEYNFDVNRALPMQRYYGTTVLGYGHRPCALQC
eukprot:9483846-Pyramimonas_sp.AAC.1